MSLRNVGIVVVAVVALAAGLQDSAYAHTSDLQDAAQANVNLIHQWTFDGADDAARRQDKKGTAHLDELVRGTGTPEDIGYGVAGLDPTSDAVSTWRQIPGSDHDGTAAFHTEITLGYSVSYEVVVQPLEANITGGDWNLGYILATRVDSNRGYFALQGSAENDGGTFGIDSNDLSSIIGTSFDVANQQTMIETLQAGHWYYLAGAYAAAADNSTTTFTNYVADLTAGQRVLTSVGPLTVPGTYPTGPTPLGIGNRWDAGEAFPGLFDEVNMYGAVLSEDVFQEHLDLLITPEQLTWDGGAGNWADSNWDNGDPVLVGPAADMGMVIDAASNDSAVTVTADFISGGSGPAASLAVGETNTASLIVNNGVTLQVTGEVAVGDSGTLLVDGTLAAGSLLSSGTLGGSGTISAEAEITGIVAPGSSTGVLTFDPGAFNWVEFDVVSGNPSYHVEIAAWDQDSYPDPWDPIPPTGAVNDLIVVASGSLVLEGEVDGEPKQSTLNLTATSQLGPDSSWFGTQTRTIIQKGADNNNEDAIDGEFEEVPVGKHLGYGVFVEAPGVEVTAAGNMEVTLLQALAGDTNGDRVVDIATDGSALILNLGTQTAMDWTKGDFNHDQAVDIGNDGSALVLNLGRTYRGGAYKGGSPGEGKDVSPGEGGGFVDQDGNIFLEMQDLALYSVYVGNDEGEQLRGTDALRLDAGVDNPVWVLPPFSTVNNAVDNPVLEAFEEMMTGGNLLTSQSYDTLVNVNVDGLVGEATSIWLKYQQLNQSAAITQLYRVPEPGTLMMLLGTGLLGLLMVTIRRRRAM